MAISRQITGSDLQAAGLVSAGVGVLTVNGGSTYQGNPMPFELKNGNNSVQFPVPSFQPSGPNATYTMALDLIPKGNPSDFAGNGVVWQDFCNRDIVANGAQAFGCAHIAVKQDGTAIFGSTAFNGATAGDVVFQINGTSKLKVLNTGLIQFSGTESFTANGSVATTMTSVGPTGAQTTVQEWLTIKNSGGTTRYLPCY